MAKSTKLSVVNVVGAVVVLAMVSSSFGATTNVTFQPKRFMSRETKMQNRQHFLDANATQPRSSIRDLIARMTVESAEGYARWLSGEASSQNSRVTTGLGVLHPFGIENAIKYVREEMEGFGFTVSLNYYREDYAPNIISCKYGSITPTEIVVLGAHIDDIPATGRAPGANDDGSGSASLLAAAKAIFEGNTVFNRTLCFEHYTGEEQGLRGSRAQAELRAGRRDNVIAMIQQDMIGVRLPGDSMGLAFVIDPRAISPELTAQVKNIGREYADPDLVLYDQVLSGSSCCSDHQSYAELGFPSVGLIEPRGYTGDPQYHRAGDLVDRDEYDTTQLTLSGQVALAAGAFFAGIVA